MFLTPPDLDNLVTGIQTGKKAQGIFLFHYSIRNLFGFGSFETEFYSVTQASLEFTR